jgi:nitrate reductase NapE component
MKKLVPSPVRVAKKIWTTTRIYARFLFTWPLLYVFFVGCSFGCIVCMLVCFLKILLY